LAEKAEKPVKEKKVGVGSVAIEAIKAGKTNEEAFAAVKAAFPDAKTTMASINWYRNKLRGDGHDVKTSRELKPAKPKAAKKDKVAKDPLA